MESVLEFGPGRRLIGVLTRPASAATHDVAVVITNSGIIHRVGANRIHVRLARRLAAKGYPCLRYDLPGIGDSERIGSGADLGEENISATLAAFDALQKAGVARRFVMVGLCSGADHSFVMSCVDPRVAGAMLIDPTGMFSTRRHRLNQALLVMRRATSPKVVWRLLRGRYRIIEALRAPALHQPLPGMPLPLSRREHEAIWRQTRSAFAALAARKARVCLVITRHNKPVYSYATQIFDAYPDLPELRSFMRVIHMPSAEHTFSNESDRRTLERGLLGWLESLGSADDTGTVGGSGLARNLSEGNHEIAKA